MVDHIDTGNYINFDEPLDTSLFIFLGNMEEVDKLGWYPYGFIVEVILL